MAVLKTLISGAGISGPALAFWLAKLGHNVTVIERSSSLRSQGQQIDIRAQAVEVCRRMGLLDTIRSKVVNEEGMRLEDVHGRCQALLLANKSGKGAQTFTSEYEIMRGDLCRIFYDASITVGATYKFGQMVTNFDQDDEGVTVNFSDGTSDRYDLLIGADGQSSKLRSMMLPAEEEAGVLKTLGLFWAYFTIPREATDSNIGPLCHVPSRLMMLRSDNPKTTQAYLGVRPESEEIKLKLKRAIDSRDVEQQKRAFTDVFQGAGWQSDRILGALNGTTAPEDFFAHEIAQIKLKAWSKGRVVLAGDAAHCPSPLSAMGTASAIVGAYVLAGEISKHCSGTERGIDDGVLAALQAYDDSLRPFINKTQKLMPGIVDLFLPRTWWAIWLLHHVFWLLSVLRVEKLAQYFGSDDVPGYKLPEYPALRD